MLFYGGTDEGSKPPFEIGEFLEPTTPVQSTTGRHKRSLGGHRRAVSDPFPVFNLNNLSAASQSSTHDLYPILSEDQQDLQDIQSGLNIKISSQIPLSPLQSVSPSTFQFNGTISNNSSSNNNNSNSFQSITNNNNNNNNNVNRSEAAISMSLRHRKTASAPSHDIFNYFTTNNDVPAGVFDLSLPGLKNVFTEPLNINSVNSHDWTETMKDLQFMGHSTDEQTLANTFRSASLDEELGGRDNDDHTLDSLSNKIGISSVTPPPVSSIHHTVSDDFFAFKSTSIDDGRESSYSFLLDSTSLNSRDFGENSSLLLSSSHIISTSNANHDSNDYYTSHDSSLHKAQNSRRMPPPKAVTSQMTHAAAALNNNDNSHSQAHATSTSTSIPTSTGTSTRSRQRNLSQDMTTHSTNASQHPPLPPAPTSGYSKNENSTHNVSPGYYSSNNHVVPPAAAPLSHHHRSKSTGALNEPAIYKSDIYSVPIRTQLSTGDSPSEYLNHTGSDQPYPVYQPPHQPQSAYLKRQKQSVTQLSVPTVGIGRPVSPSQPTDQSEAEFQYNYDQDSQAYRESYTASARDAHSSHLDKHKHASNRGKYRCGRCGQPKVNHVCPYVVDKEVCSTSTQAHPMGETYTVHPFISERTITVGAPRQHQQQQQQQQQLSNQELYPSYT